MILPAVLFLTAAALPAATAVTRGAVASPHATMHELGIVQLTATLRPERHEQQHSYAPKIEMNAPSAIRAESLITKATLPAPAITAGFTAGHENGQLPSDAAGAISSKYVLQATNAGFLAQDRTGNVLSNTSLEGFWHDPAYPDGTVYDSRVLYDAGADRWIVSTLYDVKFRKSTLLLAVSDGGNPSLGWHRYRFLVDPTDVMETDLARMVFSRDAIVVTANIYNGGGTQSEIFSIRKSDAYAGLASLPVTVTPAYIFDLVPVEGRDDSALYFVTSDVYLGLTIYKLNGSTLTGVGSAQAVANTTTPGNTLICRQLTRFPGDWLIDCGYYQVGNAVLRDSTLWVVTQPYRTSPLRSSVMWWRIAMSTPLHVDTGVIDDPTGKTMYAFPSIAVNRSGAAGIGFSVFSASIYPSAGFVYVDPFNSMSVPVTVIAGAGENSYSRWADYSTTQVDANDIDFWTTQTYSLANGYLSANQARGPLWATWWSQIKAPAVPVAPRHRAATH
ncbi:MAG: hypothetical protein QOK37_1422 [Thermoanaerobaculia bacterium]|nr:hypothetical protein [Thermoanaerobaculia bacterium]